MAVEGLCSEHFNQTNKPMKKNILILATIAALVSCFPAASNAATEVYDLKTDWSDTQNPNGTWSYRLPGGSLLPNDFFPWGYMYDEVFGDALIKTTEAAVVPGYRELDDVVTIAFIGVMARWTAPAGGTINISGAVWSAELAEFPYGILWRLKHNGVALSEGISIGTRSSPADLSLGWGGTNALLNVQVEADDHLELTFEFWERVAPFGVNLTINLTTDSVDPVSAIENLALTVVEMNLQNGISNSLDSKLDTALDAVIDVNVNNDVAAGNSLEAFINAVEAQRGRKITSAQADELIAAAEEIQALLNSGN